MDGPDHVPIGTGSRATAADHLFRKFTKTKLHILQQLLLRFRRDNSNEGYGMLPLSLICEMLGKNVSGHTFSMAILNGASSIPQSLGDSYQLHTMASLHVTHAFRVLSCEGYRFGSLVVLEYDEFNLPAQKFLKEVQGWDANRSKRDGQSHNLCLCTRVRNRAVLLG